MRLSAAAAVGMLLGLALTMSACEEGRTTAADPPTRTASTANDVGAEAARPAASHRACQRQLGPFVASLAKLRDGLARGFSYDDYLTRVRGTRGAYAGIRANRLPAGCVLLSGGPAERAFNLYIDAANAWGDCLATVTCNTRSIEPELQRKWALASRRLAVAQRGLRPARGG